MQERGIIIPLDGPMPDDQMEAAVRKAFETGIKDKLFGATPELFEALQECERLLRGVHRHSDWVDLSIDRALVAVDKAREKVK